MDRPRHPAVPFDLAARVARHGAVLALERVASVARHMAELAMARGDWTGAADAEERAIAAEHQAALMRAGETVVQLASRSG